MRYLKRTVAAFLTAAVFVYGAVSFCDVKAENVSYSDKLDVSVERGIEGKGTLKDMVFDETHMLEVADPSDASMLQNNLSNVNSFKVSMTFELKSGVSGNYFNLMEISNSAKNTSASAPAEEMALIIGKDGTVFWMTGATKGSTTWKAQGGHNISAGSHTLTASISKKGLSVDLDGTTASVAAQDNDETSKFVRAFFGAADGSSYSDWRQSVDSVTIGGLKNGSFQTHANFRPFSGRISSLTITGFNDLSDLTGDGFFESMFAGTMLDNTWLFGGGTEAQGRYEEIGSYRNYIGHFEEYIRWIKRVDGTLFGMQRYTINAGKAGQDAVSFAERLDELIEKAQPRAVSYLIGPEDYDNGPEGVEAFKEAVSAIIHKALAMKVNAGCAVIQTPHAPKDSGAAANAALYANAAAEVYNEILKEDEGNKDRMALVDHLSQTDTADFKEMMLGEDGFLNYKGHYELAKQLSQAVYGQTAGFPAISVTWEEEPLPESYLKEAPKAQAGEDSLTVTVPEAFEGVSVDYTLRIGGMEIMGTAHKNPFKIEHLPEGESYELSVGLEGGKKRLATVEGTVRDQEEAKVLEAKGELQRKIREKADDMDTPLTWLFMGDSITHGALHTYGYDSIAQIFEKYVKEDLGRTDDIVINTAVSGATAVRTCENIQERVSKYKPDIVSVMLGTNDKNAGTYESGLKEIVAAIREANPDAIIIFRSPIPCKSGWASAAVMSGVVGKMKQTAQADGNILFIDQYTEHMKECNAYTYLSNGKYDLAGDFVHATGAGHLRMAKQFIRECGLNTDAKIANLSYQFPYTEEKNSGTPPVEAETDPAAVTLTKAALQEICQSGEIGEFTVKMTASDGTVYTKGSGLDADTVTVFAKPNCRYTVEVEAVIKGATAKKTVFAAQELPLLSEEATEEDVELAESAVSEIMAVGEVTAEDLSDEAVRENVKWAVETYESLSDVQKALVSNDALKLLLAAAEELDRYEADIVRQQIRAIGGVTAEDISKNTELKTAVEKALADYDALTDTQKEKISEADKKLLDDAEKAVKQYEEDQKKPPHPGGDDPDPKDPTNTGGNGTDQKDPPSGGDPANPPKEEVYEYKNYLYAVTGDATAEVKGIKKAATKIVIPNTALINGKSYKVTSIADGAFKGDKKASSVTVGKNVETIGKSAFENCKKLKKVTVKGTKLKEIGNKAFYKCKSLKSVTIKSKALKTIGKQAFKGIHKQATIKIPSGKSKAR